MKAYQGALNVTNLSNSPYDGEYLSSAINRHLISVPTIAILKRAEGPAGLLARQ